MIDILNRYLVFIDREMKEGRGTFFARLSYRLYYRIRLRRMDFEKFSDEKLIKLYGSLKRHGRI